MFVIHIRVFVLAEVPLTCYLRNSSEFGVFLEEKLQLRPGLVQQIMTATIDSSMVGGVVGRV